MTLLAAFFGFAPMVRADESEPAPKPRDLGPPLVDNLNELKQLGKFAAWLDPKHKQVVLVGEACKADYPLEFFITTKERAYESVLVIDGEHRQEGQMSIFQQVQLALILCGAKPGHPSYYKDDKTTVASGDEIAIEVRWKNKEGKTENTDARNWIRDVKTKQPPAENLGVCRQPFRGRRRRRKAFHGRRRGIRLRAEQPDRHAGSAGGQRGSDRRPFVRGQPGKVAAPRHAGDDRADPQGPEIRKTKLEILKQIQITKLE